MYLADMSRPLCGISDGTTLNAQVAINSIALISERPSKKPIFVSGVTGTRDFLPWLKALCPSSLSYQIKGEKLMTVPRTADGFRSTVSACDPLMEQKCSMSFISRRIAACLLIKNLGRHLPEDFVLGELAALGIRDQGVLQLHYGRLTRKLPKPAPQIPHFTVVSVGT
jgi:hypothetical protein